MKTRVYKYMVVLLITAMVLGACSKGLSEEDAAKIAAQAASTSVAQALTAQPTDLPTITPMPTSTPIPPPTDTVVAPPPIGGDSGLTQADIDKAVQETLAANQPSVTSTPVPEIGGEMEPTKAPVIETPVEHAILSEQGLVQGQIVEVKVDTVVSKTLALSADETYVMVVGDVSLSDSPSGPWVRMYDDLSSSGLIVVFDEAGWVKVDYNARQIEGNLGYVQAQLTSEGCAQGCSSVVVKHFPNDFNEELARILATPTPAAPIEWDKVTFEVPIPGFLGEVKIFDSTFYFIPPQPPLEPNCSEVLTDAKNGEAYRVSCSTDGALKYLPYHLEFMMAYGDAINVNGSGTQIFLDGEPLFVVGNDQPNHRLWSVVCLKKDGCDVIADLPWAGFIGWFQRLQWDEDAVENLFLNQARLIIKPDGPLPIPEGQATPVPNCMSTQNGCQLIWAGQWVITDDDVFNTANGVYIEAISPFWFPYVEPTPTPSVTPSPTATPKP
jgi:hypothetical protein